MDLWRKPIILSSYIECPVKAGIMLRFHCVTLYIFTDLKVWIDQIAHLCSGIVVTCLDSSLNLYSHLSDMQIDQKSAFAREKESWGNLACISEIWIWTDCIWHRQLKKVGHLGSEALWFKHNYLMLTLGQGHSLERSFCRRLMTFSITGYDTTGVMEIRRYGHDLTDL